METIKASTVRRAIHKAREQAPAIYAIGDGYYALPSATRPGAGYLVEVGADGYTHCECEGSQRAGYCWHRAAVGLLIGTIPSRFLDVAGVELDPWPAPAEAAPTRASDTAPLRTPASLGRSALFG